MNHLNPVKTGLVFGKIFGLVHVIWVILVALGLAQAVVNFGLWAHMATLPLVVGAFDFTAAITVILVAVIVGYVLGYVFARIWNYLHR